MVGPLGRIAAGLLAVLLAGGCASARVSVSYSDPVPLPVTDSVPDPALVVSYGAVLAGLFAEVDARYRVRRADLEQAARPAGGITLRAAQALLTVTERDLLAALGEAGRTLAAEPEEAPSGSGSDSSLELYGIGEELAPLVDWVEVRFAELFAELRRGSPDDRQARAAPGRVAAAAGYRLASRPPAAGAARGSRPDLVPPVLAASVLDGAGLVIRLLLRRAEEDRLTIDLCVRTSPPGARVVVFPASYRHGARSGLSDHLFVRLFRGVYLYRIESAGGAALECAELPAQDRQPVCAPLDLMDDDRAVWSCELERGRGRTPGCRRRDRSPGECAE